MLAKKLTPLLRQYLDIKQQYNDCLIFFRLGDFYELFFEDAEIAAKTLSIALTKRGQVDGEDIPMCGVPHHHGDSYLAKLLKNGFLPTRYADSFAIALGGAAFYRNRVNALVKQGMDVKQAEQQAMNDWRKEAENSQQSADPSKISEIQASSLGRIIYAFANTPFQYARIVKRRLQDITSGRSAAEGRVQSDLGTILYYGAVQAVMFNALQSGLAALAFGEAYGQCCLDQVRDQSLARQSCGAWQSLP